jgi:hypothetical protein
MAENDALVLLAARRDLARGHQGPTRVGRVPDAGDGVLLVSLFHRPKCWVLNHLPFKSYPALVDQYLALNDNTVPVASSHRERHFRTCVSCVEWECKANTKRV